MCTMVAAGWLLGGVGGGLGAMEYEKQQREAKRAERDMQAKYKSLMSEYKEETAVKADSYMRGLTTRDKQRILARSMSGTLYTSPLGVQTTPLGKQSLLGE